MWTSKGQGSGIVRWQSDSSFGGTQQMKGYEGYELMNKDNHKIGGTYPNIENYSTKEFESMIALRHTKVLSRDSPRIFAPIKISPLCC